VDKEELIGKIKSVFKTIVIVFGNIGALAATICVLVTLGGIAASGSSTWTEPNTALLIVEVVIGLLSIPAIVYSHVKAIEKVELE